MFTWITSFDLWSETRKKRKRICIKCYFWCAMAGNNNESNGLTTQWNVFAVVGSRSTAIKTRVPMIRECWLKRMLYMVLKSATPTHRIFTDKARAINGIYGKIDKCSVNNNKTHFHASSSHFSSIFFNFALVCAIFRKRDTLCIWLETKTRRTRRKKYRMQVTWVGYLKHPLAQSVKHFTREVRSIQID